jgi:phage tail-like protein
MAEFTVNPTRYDPYKFFNFKVKWDGVYVAGMSKMSALTRTTAPVSHRVGGLPAYARLSPGLTTYTPVTFERGVTHDPAFEAWANKVSSYGAPGISLPDFRKDIIVDLFNEAGQLAISYHLYRCWVSEYSAVPALDAGTAAVSIQTIKIENEGWERDASVLEPKELSV